MAAELAAVARCPHPSPNLQANRLPGERIACAILRLRGHNGMINSDLADLYDVPDRVAVFVDAGYVFAQGSVPLAGRKLPRSEVTPGPRSNGEGVQRLFFDNNKRGAS